MSRSTRRCTRALLVAVAVCGAFVLAAPSASADPKVPFNQDIYASTHLAKSGIDITVPRGVFTGSVDLATGEESGTLSLPPATVTMNLFGAIPVADASFVMSPAGPITGHVDLATFAVDTTASFNVRLASLTPHGTSVNLVGDGCTTVEPVTVRMQGIVNPATGGTFSSTYTIPDFEDCQALTPVITAFVSGPGNTFTATFVPQGGTAPAAPAPPAPAPTPLPIPDVHLHQDVPVPPVADVHVDVDAGLGITLPAAPPLLTATPAPTTTTAPAPPTTPPLNPITGLLRSLLGG